MIESNFVSAISNNKINSNEKNDIESKFLFHQEDDVEYSEHDENYELDTKVNYKVFDNCEYYTNNMEDFAKQQILKFFSGKELHCGGKIPHSLLENSKRVNMVVNLDLDSSINIFYNHSEGTMSQEELERYKKTGEVSWDIILVNDSLKLLAKSGVPQQFAGGMLLIYLELVKGYEIKF